MHAPARAGGQQQGKQCAELAAGMRSAELARTGRPDAATGQPRGHTHTQPHSAPRRRRACHIAVGTPGRVCALLSNGALPTRALRTLVLDEADSLLGEGFYSDIAWAHDQLPAKKQVRAQGGYCPCTKCHQPLHSRLPAACALM